AMAASRAIMVALPEAELHRLAALAPTVMDKPVAFVDERIKRVHEMLRCSSGGLDRAKELSQRALTGLSKHGLHFGASFGRCRLMNEYEIGSDCVFGDLRLPEREAHLCSDFMQLVLGQWHHSLRGPNETE